MNTIEEKRKTIFLNGVEVESIEPTGNSSEDLAAAQRFLAQQGIKRPQGRQTLRARIVRAWRTRFHESSQP